MKQFILLDMKGSHDGYQDGYWNSRLILKLLCGIVSGNNFDVEFLPFRLDSLD